MIKIELLECCENCDKLDVVNYGFVRCEETGNWRGMCITCSHMLVCEKAKREESGPKIKVGDVVTLTGTVEGLNDVPFPEKNLKEATVKIKNENGIEYVTVWADLLEKKKEGD